MPLFETCFDPEEFCPAAALAGDDIHAHCIFWRATVVDQDGQLQWDIQFPEAERLLEWLPLDYRPEEPLFWAWGRACSPEEAARMLRVSTDAIRGGKPGYTQKFHLTLRDGQTRMLREFAQISPDGDRRWRLQGVCTDVTEREREQADLQKIMGRVRCLIWHAEVEGDPRQGVGWDFQVSNEAAAQRWLPLSLEPGETFTQAWAGARLTEDLERCDRLCAEALATGQPRFSQEFRVRLADGTVRWLAEDVQIEPLDTGRWRLVGVCTDITERRLEQDTLNEVMTRARCLVWHAEVTHCPPYYDWRISIFNEEAARRWLDIASEPGRSYTLAWSDARFPEDVACCDRMFEAALREGQPGYSQEFRVRLADGTVRWLAEDVHIEPLDTGRWCFVGVCTDITERKVLEAEREQMLSAALAQADRDPLTGLLNHRAFHACLHREAERARREGSGLGIAVIDLDNFKFFNDAYGHLVGDDVLRRVAEALQGHCRTYDTLCRYGGDEFAVLMPGVPAEELARLGARLSACLDTVEFRPPGASGTIPLSLSVGTALFPEDADTPLDTLHLADERLMRVKTGGRADGATVDCLRASLAGGVAGFSMLDALVAAVDNKDRYTRAHSEDVLIYCLEIAAQMRLDEDALHWLQIAALLHDVGKIGIPDSILRKPGRLTESEYCAMQQHPVMGAAIVGAVPGLERTLDAVRYHHEHWDGSGYPDNLRGEEIPLSARIMAVADAYSAMTTDRPYRKGMSREAALTVLEDGAASQWDPHCVSAFLNAQRRRDCLKAGMGY